MDGNIDQTHEQVERPQGTSRRGMPRNACGGTAAAASAGRGHVRGARMNAKYVVASVVLLGTILAGLAGLSGAVGGVPRAAHADSPVPTVTSWEINHDPLSVEAFGTDFTPGGAVHIDLVLAYWQYAPTPDGSGDPPVTPVPVPTLSPYYEGAPQIVASVDTTAARTTYVSNGHGIVFSRQGGYFDATLTSPSPTCGGFSYWLVATDEATGTTSTNAKVGTLFNCS